MKPAIAGVIGNTRGIDELVAGFACSLIQRGWQVRGLVQEAIEGNGHGCTIVLVDLDNGTLYPITSDLGPGSASCRLDTGALAEASVVMRRIAAKGADLVVFNRFAGQEASGKGFAAEMASMVMQGIPVLTIIPEKHLADWRHFTGGLSSELEPQRAALENWFFGLQATRAVSTKP